MKLKLIEVEGKQYAEVKDGKPVFIEDDGKETAFDAMHTISTISRLNGEAKSHRERADAAEKSLSTFSGIEDPTAAMKALDTVKNLDDKKLVDAGEVERVKSEAIKAIEAQYSPIKDENQALRDQLRSEKIGGSFARSKFIQENLAIPADMAQAQFGSQFSIEEGKMVAKDLNGNQIFSRERPGEPADFEEALSAMVDQYPHKESILKGTQSSGSGAEQGVGVNQSGKSLRDAGSSRSDRVKAISSKFPELPVS